LNKSIIETAKKAGRKCCILTPWAMGCVTGLAMWYIQPKKSFPAMDGKRTEYNISAGIDTKKIVIASEKREIS
jgi:hypothetical protein